MDRKILDLEHFVLRDGETLILRYTSHPTAEQIAQMRAAIGHALPDAAVLVLPPTVEVMAGVIDVVAPEQEQEERAHIKAAIMDAYDMGKMVYFCPIGDTASGWLMAHKVAAPHPLFDWTANHYSLTSKAPLP